MSRPLRIGLRAGERIYINGAVLKVDRRVTLELLNDVTFLLEGHVLQPEEAATPVRRLYFWVQTMLIDPAQAVEGRTRFEELLAPVLAGASGSGLTEGLVRAGDLVQRDRIFEALRVLRALFPAEADFMSREKATNQLKECGHVDKSYIDAGCGQRRDGERRPEPQQQNIA